MSRAARRLRGRVLDWKFLAALAFLLMVAYLVIGGYTEQVAKGRRIDQLIHIGQDKDKDAEAARKAASQERDRLLANQERLLRAIRNQERRQAAFGRYLKAAGVTLNIPDALKDQTNGAAGGRKDHTNTAAGAPKDHTNRPPKTSPKPGPPDSPSPEPGGPAPPPPPNPVQDLLDRLKGLIP